MAEGYRRKKGDPTYQDLINFLAAMARQLGGKVNLTSEEMTHKKGLELGIVGNMEVGYKIDLVEVPVSPPSGGDVEEE